MVKIHKALKEGKTHYEATRGKWRINKDRPDYIQYIKGIDKVGRRGKDVDTKVLLELRNSKQLLISSVSET